MNHGWGEFCVLGSLNRDCVVSRFMTQEPRYGPWTMVVGNRDCVTFHDSWTMFGGRFVPRGPWTVIESRFMTQEPRYGPWTMVGGRFVSSAPWTVLESRFMTQEPRYGPWTMVGGRFLSWGPWTVMVSRFMTHESWLGRIVSWGSLNRDWVMFHDSRTSLHSLSGCYRLLTWLRPSSRITPNQRRREGVQFCKSR